MADRQRKTAIEPSQIKINLCKKDWMTVMSGRNISFKVLFVRLADVVFADAKYRLVLEGVLVREAPAGKRCRSNGILPNSFSPTPLQATLWQLCLSKFSQSKHLKAQWGPPVSDKQSKEK